MGNKGFRELEVRCMGPELHSQLRPLQFPVQTPPSVPQEVALAFLFHRSNQKKSIDESLLGEESSLSSAISKSKHLRKKGNGPGQHKGKRSKPVDDQDDKTDEELKKAESLFFLRKREGDSQIPKTRTNPKTVTKAREESEIRRRARR